MAILSFKTHCAFNSDGSQRQTTSSPELDNPKSCPFRKRVNEILKDENRFLPNSEFKNLSLEESQGAAGVSSEDEGDRSSSDDEKCMHDCAMDVEYEDTLHALCGTLTEECVVESLAENNANKVDFFFFERE